MYPVPGERETRVDPPSSEPSGGRARTVHGLGQPKRRPAAVPYDRRPNLQVRLMSDVRGQIETYRHVNIRPNSHRVTPVDPSAPTGTHARLYGTAI